MKSKFKDREDPMNPLSARKNVAEEPLQTQSGISPRGHFKTNSESSAANDELMNRLANGQKANVDKKAMRQLTIKNYEKLPEIIKKKQEAQRLEDYKAAKEKAAAY